MPTVSHHENFSFLASYYKNHRQFCILVESSTISGIEYTEYNVDFGEPPFIGGSDEASKGFRLNPMQHSNLESFKEKINNLNNLGYKNTFIGQEQTEKINQFVARANESNKGFCLKDEIAHGVRWAAKESGIDLRLEQPVQNCVIS